jgi:hypothetical protein
MAVGGGGGPTDADAGAGAGWKRRWLVDLVQAVLMALALLAAIVLGLLFLYNSMPHGELGTPSSQPVPAATTSP